MFHRVAPQSSNKESAAAESSKEASARTPVSSSPSANQGPKIQNNQDKTSNDQPTSETTRKDSSMNSESENKLPHGNYSPTPATPQGGSRMDIPGARPAPQAPTRPGTPYPGAQNTTSSYSPSPAAANKDAVKKLQIGPGITLSGEIEDCEYLYVEGTVEATLKGASVLEIAESGAFYGTVEIDEATIAGRFEGDLTVRGRLTIEASGSITGSVAYKELAVEAGATLDGKVSPIGGSAVSEGNFGKGKAKKAANASSADNELPFSDKVAATAAE